MFKDPRLHHLNPEFSRNSLNHSDLERFATNTQEMKAALDAIIEFNNQINEFNFMYEVYNSFKTVLMKKKLAAMVIDWTKLY